LPETQDSDRQQTGSIFNVTSGNNDPTGASNDSEDEATAFQLTAQTLTQRADNEIDLGTTRSTKADESTSAN
jgi:hypothetical protein